MRVVDNWIYMNTLEGSPLPNRSAGTLSRSVREGMLNGTVNKKRNESIAQTRAMGVVARFLQTRRNYVTFARTKADCVRHILTLLGSGIRGRLLISESFRSHFPKSKTPAQIVPEYIPDRITGETLLDMLKEDVSVLFLEAVDTASGALNPLREMASICREAGVKLVLDASLYLGAFNYDPAEVPVDILIAEGNRWLLGPEEVYIIYSSLNKRPTQLDSTPPFGYLSALSRSLLMLGDCEMTDLENYIQLLIEQFIAGIQESPFELISPRNRAERSAIALFRHPEMEAVYIGEALLEHRIVCGVTGDRIAISPHAYNTPAEIDKVLDALRKIEGRFGEQPESG
jgi:selenocysteine lyase/cysteine desulfurase